jgi:hypothetical protein
VEGKVVDSAGKPLPDKEILLLSPRQQSAEREAVQALFSGNIARGPAYQGLSVRSDNAGLFHAAFPPHTRRISAPYILFRGLSPRRHARDVVLYIRAIPDTDAHELQLNKRGVRAYRLFSDRDKSSLFQRHAASKEKISAKGKRSIEKDLIVFSLGVN